MGVEKMGKLVECCDGWWRWKILLKILIRKKFKYRDARRMFMWGWVRMVFVGICI